MKSSMAIRPVWILFFFIAMSAVLFAGGAREVEAQETGDGPVIEAAGMRLSWEASGDELIFTLRGETTGWLALGIEPSRMMKDGNFILLYVSDGKLYGTDHYGTGMFTHKEDTSLGGSEDLRLISGEEKDGVTTVRFALPLDSGDEYDQPLLLGEEHLILLAHGPDGADNFSTKHRAKGKVKVVF